MNNVTSVPLHLANLLHRHAPAHQGRFLDILPATFAQSTVSTVDRRRLRDQLWIVHGQPTHFRLPMRTSPRSIDDSWPLACAVYGSRICAFRAVCNCMCALANIFSIY
jgi:hypothetical protein